MNAAEALATVELVEVEWPRFSIPDETKQAWSVAIMRGSPHATPNDGYEAVTDLAAARAFPPALAELVDAIEETRRANLRKVAPVAALPAGTSKPYPFALFLNEHPEMAERVMAMTDHPSLVGSTLTTLLAGEMVK